MVYPRTTAAIAFRLMPAENSIEKLFIITITFIIIIIIIIIIIVKGLNPGVISKVGWVWSSGWTLSWIGLFLLTVTDVSSTCGVVIFGVKVSCITSVDGIILWLWIWLVNYIAMLLVVCQLSQMLLAMKTRDQWLVRFDPSIVTVKVIPWFCTAHLLLRITRWPPWKRACEVTLLKARWPKRNAIAIFAYGCFLPRWDSMWWECA